MNEQKRKKQLIIVGILLLCIFGVVAFRSSYALFEENIEGNKINFVVGKLNYSLILDENGKENIELKAGEYKVIHIELINTNDVDAKYAFVYKNENININNLAIGYLTDYGSSASDETIKSGEKKQIYIGVHNKSEKSIKLELGVRGGLPNNTVEVENGYTKITGNASETYKDSILNGADPVLGDGMIPITLDDDGTVHYASLYSEWYNYSSKVWANAVILVNTPSQDYNIGDIIEEKDIQSYFVWIPRYRYKLFNLGDYSETIDSSKITDVKDDDSDVSMHNILGSAKLIDIQFETEEKKTQDGKDNECASDNTSGGGTNCQVGNYMTHPAFTLGETELNGIWVGKFETGYNQNQNTNDPITTTSEWSTAGAERDENASSKVIIKPNVYSWRSITVGNIFKTALEYKKDLGSHMMKNTEWGALAYLTQSEYGIGNEIRINNNSDFKTGYSSAPNLDQSSYTGESGNTSGMTKPYNTPIGYLASTTGNITGIYDMAGGAHEYMASYVEGHVAESSSLTSSDLTTYAKYFDKYLSNSSETSYKNRILGDATGEMGPFYSYRDKDGGKRNHNSWYADGSYFVAATSPWFSRGGTHSNGVLAGQFHFSRDPDGVKTILGSRLVLTGKEEITS